jgi:hypothetical protein
MRERAALSGAMLKFVIVCAISWNGSQWSYLDRKFADCYCCGIFIEKHDCCDSYAMIQERRIAGSCVGC